MRRAQRSIFHASAADSNKATHEDVPVFFGHLEDSFGNPADKCHFRGFWAIADFKSWEMFSLSTSLMFIPIYSSPPLIFIALNDARKFVYKRAKMPNKLE